jgi:hypothetical protein
VCGAENRAAVIYARSLQTIAGVEARARFTL